MKHLFSMVAARAGRAGRPGALARLGVPDRDARRILVVGVGSAGCSAAEWVFEEVPGVTTLTVNTDRASLERHKSHLKLLIGERLFHGRGAQGLETAAARAARESERELSELFRGYEIITVLAALGGGTGSGASPVAAGLARSQGAAVVAVAALPFKVERARRERALQTIEDLKAVSHTTILLDSEALLAIAGSLPVGLALGVMDYFMAEVPRSIERTLAIAQEGRVAAAETRAILMSGGLGTVCYAEWGAEGAQAAVPLPLIPAGAGHRPSAAIVHIASHDGRAPGSPDAIISGVAASLHGDPPPSEHVRLSVSRDPAFEQGGRLVSIVVGLDSRAIREEAAPRVTLTPSVATPPRAPPEVRPAEPPAQVCAENAAPKADLAPKQK